MNGDNIQGFFEQFKMGTGVNGAVNQVFDGNIIGAFEKILEDMTRLHQGKAPAFQQFFEFWEKV